MKALARGGLLLFGILFVVCIGWANPTHLYLAVAGQGTGTFQSIHRQSGESELELDSGIGYQFEIGTERGRWLGYLGFRHENIDYEPSFRWFDEPEYKPTEWKASYVLIGGRWILTGRESSPVYPFLGAGISAGWASRKSEVESQKIGPRIGLLSELGLKVPVGHRISFWALGRLERLGFNFPTTESMDRMSYLLQPSLHAGLSYRLPAIRQ